MADLPPPSGEGPYRIALVCLGNICRSPMAHVVLEQRLGEAGLVGAVEVTSSGTGDWHLGSPMDERAAATLTEAGYDATRHRARHFDTSWLAAHELVLVMDESNLHDVRRLAGARSGEEPGQVRLFRDLDPVEPGAEVPDPYFGDQDGFSEVLAMIERTSDALVVALADTLGREVVAR